MGATTRERLLSYFVSTPYIDAYDHDYPPSKPQIDYEAFVQKMKGQAYAWGEQGVGRAVIDGLVPATHGDSHVLAFGTHGAKKYVAVATPSGVSVVEVAEIPNEWDVT